MLTTEIGLVVVKFDSAGIGEGKHTQAQVVYEALLGRQKQSKLVTPALIHDICDIGPLSKR